MPARVDGRAPADLRPVRITSGVIEHAEGSVLIEVGRTRVICTASVEDRVPAWLKGSGQGWVTAEYGMLPRATPIRNQREVAKGRVSGRTSEIQRLVGRSLRAVTHLRALGELTVWMDCDVIQADGGTRTASITGAYVALVLAFAHLRSAGQLSILPVTDFLAASSVGIVGGEVLLDLAYEEDSQAQVDMNLVMTGRGEMVEVQATAEAAPFTPAQFQSLLALGEDGIRRLIQFQKQALGPLAAEVEHNGSEIAAGRDIYPAPPGDRNGEPG